LVVATLAVLVVPAAAAQRLAAPIAPVAPVARVSLRADSSLARLSASESSPQAPSGEQIVTGYLGSVLIGFLAWRAFDEPAGRHSKVRDGWGYTPRAHAALIVGSFVGATTGVWSRGRAKGATGKLLGTALGAAIPTVPAMLMHDDPLLPFMTAIFWSPLQGVAGYVGYIMTARHVESDDAPTIAAGRTTTPTESGANVIRAADIARTGASNLYDAVLQLRPQWFSFARLRATTPSDLGGEPAKLMIYLEGASYGDIEALKRLAVAGVQEVRFYDALAATNRFGTGHSAGVIAVSMSAP
jgi:hypothetical protein